MLMATATSAVIVFSAVRGVRAGYEAVNDNALIELRGRDVLTANHPLLGTWSSASISSGIDVNHPGPLLFDLVAAPVKILGGATGIAVAIALLNVAVVWLVGWVTWRVGGATAALTAQVVTAGLVWTLGSELLYDPWQPNVLVLVFWLVMCAAWAVAADEVVVLPLAIGAGSFAMQTHLGYVFVVPILVGFAFARVIIRRRRLGPGRFGDLRRPVTISVAVAVVLWAQPLWEQIFGAGRGNLTRVLIAGTVGGDDFVAAESSRTGITVGVRILGAVLALPPWWGRPGFDSSIPSSTWVETSAGRMLDAPGLRTVGPAVVGLLVLAALIALGWRRVRQAGGWQLEAGFQLLAVALAVGAVTVIITPIDVLGLSPHKVRWLWVIGAFGTYMLLMAVLVGLREDRRRATVGVMGAIGVVALAATIPTHANQAGPVIFRATYDSIGNVRDQVEDFLATSPEAPSAVVFDAGGIGFAEPYTVPVLAELVEGGVDVFTFDSSFARQLGPQRYAGAGASALPVVFVRVGSDALSTPPGAVRIAFHDGELTPFDPSNVTDRAVGVFLADPP